MIYPEGPSRLAGKLFVAAGKQREKQNDLLRGRVCGSVETESVS